MSGAGTAAKPRLPFCWVCSRKLHGRFHRVAVVHGLEVVVHADCAKREGLDIKDGAHLARVERGKLVRPAQPSSKGRTGG
jgi:hypothetical protein